MLSAIQTTSKETTLQEHAAAEHGSAHDIALPDLMEEFSVPSGTAQWMVVGYMLAVGVALPCVGFLLKWVKAKTLVMVASTDR